MFRDYFVPRYLQAALQRADKLQTSEYETDGVRFERLDLDPAALEIIGRQLRRRRAELFKNVNLADRDGLAARLAGLRYLADEITQADSPFRQEALDVLPRISGFSRQMITLLLDSFADLVCIQRLGDNGRLPPNRAAVAFVKTSHGYARYYSGLLGLSAPRLLALSSLADQPSQPLPLIGTPQVVTNIAAGNVPGIAILESLFPVFVGAASLGKNSSAEPYFGPKFLSELAATEERQTLFPLSDLIVLVTFAGTDTLLLEEIIRQGDHVRVTGGRDSKREINRIVRRQRLGGWRDLRRRVSGHWHKVSFDVVASEYLTDDWLETIAGNVAFDNSMFNTQGCLSCQQVFVEGSHEQVLEFGHVFVERMKAILARLPKGDDPQAGLREMYHRFEGKPNVTILTGLRDMDQYPFFAACDLDTREFAAQNALNRSVLIRRVNRLEQDLPRLLGDGTSGDRVDLLQSCGLAIPQERLLTVAEILGEAGVNRIVAAGDIWNMTPGIQSWDGYLPPYDIIAPQMGYWTTISFRDPDQELRRVQARNTALLQNL